MKTKCKQIHNAFLPAVVMCCGGMIGNVWLYLAMRAI